MNILTFPDAFYDEVNNADGHVCDASLVGISDVDPRGISRC